MTPESKAKTCQQTVRLPGPIWERPLSGDPRSWDVPSEAECLALWDRFQMPEHIRAHSLTVAQVAEFLALAAAKAGMDVDASAVRASALLHDLAKLYTIVNGGNHAQLGGAWVMQITGNPAIAQGVLHHVYWPWDLDLDRSFLALAVLYADKRVRHEGLVGVRERYADLISRYGRNQTIIDSINSTKDQTLRLEAALNERLGMDIDACDFDREHLA